MRRSRRLRRKRPKPFLYVRSGWKADPRLSRAARSQASRIVKLQGASLLRSISKTAGWIGRENSTPAAGPSIQQTIALIASTPSNLSHTCSSSRGRSTNSILHPCVETSRIVTLNLGCPVRLRTTSALKAAFKATLAVFRGCGVPAGLCPLSMRFLPRMVSATSRKRRLSLTPAALVSAMGRKRT